MKKLFFVAILLVFVPVLSGCDFLFFGDPKNLPPTPSTEEFNFLPDFKPGESVYENVENTENRLITPSVSTPDPDTSSQSNQLLDICCYDSKAKLGERYYIPFDGSGCIEGHQQVPLDKDCGNPLLYE